VAGALLAICPPGSALLPETPHAAEGSPLFVDGAVSPWRRWGARYYTGQHSLASLATER
jgi:hypothetical protein